MIIDLHTHSHYSPDGKLSIPELLGVYSAGDIVALTDHETIAGWTEFKEEARKRCIRPMLGVEWMIKNCCHILSYFVSEIPQNFKDFMTERRDKERYAMRLLYERVKVLYPSLSSYENILLSKAHPENILGMAALADDVSHVSQIDFKEAVGLLRDIKGKLPDNNKPTTFFASELIEKIREWNGISVLAHPFKNSLGKSGRQSREDVAVKISELAGFGIAGVELFSEGSNLAELDFLLVLSKKFGLIVSIGSDYHSQEKGLEPAVLEKLEESVKDEVIKWLDH
jgi:hypothetical protein